MKYFYLWWSILLCGYFYVGKGVLYLIQVYRGSYVNLHTYDWSRVCDCFTVWETDVWAAVPSFSYNFLFIFASQCHWWLFSNISVSATLGLLVLSTSVHIYKMYWSKLFVWSVTTFPHSFFVFYYCITVFLPVRPSWVSRHVLLFTID